MSSFDELIAVLPLTEIDVKDGNIVNVIPYHELNIEKTLFWFALVDAMRTHKDPKVKERLNEAICSLRSFCQYVIG